MEVGRPRQGGGIDELQRVRGLGEEHEVVRHRDLRHAALTSSRIRICSPGLAAIVCTLNFMSSVPMISTVRTPLASGLAAAPAGGGGIFLWGSARRTTRILASPGSAPTRRAARRESESKQARAGTCQVLVETSGHQGRNPVIRSWCESGDTPAIPVSPGWPRRRETHQYSTLTREAPVSTGTPARLEQTATIHHWPAGFGERRDAEFHAARDRLAVPGRVVRLRFFSEIPSHGKSSRPPDVAEDELDVRRKRQEERVRPRRIHQVSGIGAGEGAFV